MISAKGLELTNFINPELTWKTVTKGYRRSTRRSRKPVDRSPKSDTDLTDKGAESPSETTVSESEKLGVAVLGQRFSEKIEHVPIKKRRFTVRSPSPPPCFSSSRVEINNQFLDGPYISDQQSCLKLMSKRRLVTMDASRKSKNVKHSYNEDFSGIEILAAAACNNVGDDENHEDNNHSLEEASKECRDKSKSALPLGECILSNEATHTSPIDTAVEAATEGSDLPERAADENHHNGASDSHNDTDKRTVERSISSRDVRLHWDLNVEMDAWEQPCDSLNVDSQTKAAEDVQSEKLQVSEACELQKESRDVKNNIGTLVQPIIDNEEHKLESSSGIDKNDGKCVPSDKALESLMSPGIVAENSQDVTGDAITNLFPCKESDNVKGFVLSEETKGILSIDSASKQMNEDLSLGAQASKEEKLGADCEVDSTLLKEDGVSSAMVSSLHSDLKSQEIMSSDSCPPVPVNKVEEVGIGHTELFNEDVSASGVNLEESQRIVKVHMEEQVSEALMAHTDDSKAVALEFSGNCITILDAGVGSTSHEVSKKCGDSSASSLGRVATEDTCDDSHVLDVCDNDHSVGKGNTKGSDKDQIVGKENTTDFDPGYDSQYEDGELRESDLQSWEDGEAECVDYDGSDTFDDAGDHSMSSKFGMQVECSEEEFCGTEVRSLDRNMKVDRVLGLGSDNLCEKVECGAAGDALRQQALDPKIMTSGSDELPRSLEISSNRTAEIHEGCLVRKHNADCLDGFDDKDSPAKMVGSGVSRKELLGIESSSSDTLHRSDHILVQRNRSSNFDLCTQPEETRADHSMGKERSDMQMHCKSPGGYWDSRRRESPTYNGSFGSERPRPKSVIEGRGYAMHSEAVGIAGADNHVHRPGMNSSSNGSYRHPLRRRSPVNRDDAHNIHRGMAPLRDASPDRRRFRRYPQGVGRGFREDYHRTLPQNGSDEYPYHVNRMVRREQNTSPPPRGPVYYRRPYKRSQSRSRSRSPGSWILSREHEVAKHRSSRSPDYRFESRMERMRMPFQKQNFGAKYEMGFLSPPRRRFSPQHNSRWFDDPNGASDHFRGRRLPARTFQQQGQRFDSVGSSRRLNSDDYCEPTMRPGRFSEMGRGGGRVRRYEGSDDERRKHDGRYEIFPRVRRYDSDGVVRQFRYDEEDSFSSRNTHNYNDSDNNNGAERRPRNNVYLGELVKRKVNN